MNRSVGTGQIPGAMESLSYLKNVERDTVSASNHSASSRFQVSVFKMMVKFRKFLAIFGIKKKEKKIHRKYENDFLFNCSHYQRPFGQVPRQPFLVTKRFLQSVARRKVLFLCPYRTKHMRGSKFTGAEVFRSI